MFDWLVHPRTQRGGAVLSSCLVMTFLGIVALWTAGYRINVTPSVPVGLWHVHRPTTPLEPGMFVSVCLPERLGAFGRARGYIGSGRCPGATLALLKRIVGVSGDRVCVATAATRVERPDGIRFTIPFSARQSHDQLGRPLNPVPIGCRVLPAGRLWLSGDGDERSWDSRYYGAIDRSAITAIAQATPLITRPIVHLYLVKTDQLSDRTP